MTGTSAENTRVATSGSNRGASQPATGTSPTGRGCGPWKSAWSAEHRRHYDYNKLTREAVWELPTVSRPSAPPPAVHDPDTSGAHQEPEGRPAKRQRIPSQLTTIRSAEATRGNQQLLMLTALALLSLVLPARQYFAPTTALLSLPMLRLLTRGSQTPSLQHSHVFHLSNFSACGKTTSCLWI
jgi:hypothetical protein